ncbi:hypothetical protein HIM_00751 [Hirsutella minnesotensis 3608]|nr:hypothetical protein HIM_00751 [Hirsutella minnesotensis 3608]
MTSPEASPSASAAPELHARRRNTKNLAWRFAADLTSALAAGALVAPVISIIDRSIMENASGRSPSILASIRTSLARRPAAILLSRPTALVLLLYGGTYFTANALDTPVPLPCYALFTLRDCITIFASFNLPPLLAPHADARLAAAGLANHLSGLSAAQFLAPAAVQLLSTPIHLLGLDLYNRPGPRSLVPWGMRWRAVCSNWLASAAARVCRIVPAFGVGGVVNLKLRRRLMLPLE